MSPRPTVFSAVQGLVAEVNRAVYTNINPQHVLTSAIGQQPPKHSPYSRTKPPMRSTRRRPSLGSRQSEHPVAVAKRTDKYRDIGTIH